MRCAAFCFLRFLRRKIFILGRTIVFSFWKLWISRIDGLNNLPSREGSIIFINHTSYLDFLLFRPILKSDCVFIANDKLKKHRILNWFMRYGNVIFLDLDNPGYRSLRELVRFLKSGRNVVIYPEGTRSRSGKMGVPRIGFVKLALKNNVPVLPVVVKGAYGVWPPHRKLPSFKRCEIFLKKRIYISPSAQIFKDVFFRQSHTKKFDKLNRRDYQIIAFRLMEIIRVVSGQEWDVEAKAEVEKLAASGFLNIFPNHDLMNMQ